MLLEEAVGAEMKLLFSVYVSIYVDASDYLNYLGKYGSAWFHQNNYNL